MKPPFAPSTYKIKLNPFRLMIIRVACLTKYVITNFHISPDKVQFPVISSYSSWSIPFQIHHSVFSSFHQKVPLPLSAFSSQDATVCAYVQLILQSPTVSPHYPSQAKGTSSSGREILKQNKLDVNQPVKVVCWRCGLRMPHRWVEKRSGQGYKIASTSLAWPRKRTHRGTGRMIVS